MGFKFTKTAIPEVVLVKRDVFTDARGHFSELFKNSVFTDNGLNIKFVQTNYSRSKKNVLRGLHYQSDSMAQGKFVQVINGKIFDVAVDLRKSSPYYGKWVGETLSLDNGKMLYIPEGFAHGFCVLSESADVIYQCTQEYSPEHDSGIIWNDPQINISWPIKNPIVSKKDAQLPLLGK